MNKMEKITIDKTIEIFEGIKKGISPWYPEPYYDMAINTMRNFQKIEQIYQKWNEVNDFSYNQAMREIGEVMEDGTENDD